MEKLKSLNVSREDLERTKRMLDDLENSGIKFDDSLIADDDGGDSSESCDTDLRSDRIKDYVTNLSDPDMCGVEGEGLSKAIVGIESQFVITARDSDGNVVKSCNDIFHIDLKMDNGSQIRAEVHNNLNGTFTVSYVPQVVGDYEMTISLFDEELADYVGTIKNKNSSDGKFKVVVSGNPQSDPSKCVLKAGKTDVNGNRKPLRYRAGQLIEDIVLQSRDTFGNNGIGGEKYNARILSKDGSIIEPEKVVDSHNGLYQFLFKVEKAALYDIEFTYESTSGQLTSLTHVNTQVKIEDSGKTDPQNCVFIGLASNLQTLVASEEQVDLVESKMGPQYKVSLERKAGEVTRFLIQARDQFGNIREIDSHEEDALPQIMIEQFSVIASMDDPSDKSPSVNADDILMTPRTAMVASKIEGMKGETDTIAIDSSIVKLPVIGSSSGSDDELSTMLGLTSQQSKFSGGAQELEKAVREALSKFVSPVGHHGLYLVETKLVLSGKYTLQCRVSQTPETSTSTAESVEEQKSKQSLFAVGSEHTVKVHDCGVTDAQQCVVIQSFSKGVDVSKTIVIPNIKVGSSVPLNIPSEEGDSYSDTFKKFHAGREMHIIVQSRDKFGNNREVVDGEEFLLKLTPKQNEPTTPSSDLTHAVQYFSSTPFVQGNGLFEIVFSVNAAQGYLMELCHVDKKKLPSETVELQEKVALGQNIKTFPQEVVVTDAAVTDAQRCLLSGTGITTAVQGKETFFVVRMRDAFYNNRKTGGDKLEVTLISDARKIETPASEIIDNQDGTYTVKYTPKASGKNRFEIKINGELLTGNEIIQGGVFVSPPNIEDASNVETILDHDLLNALLNAFRVEHETDNLVEQIQALRQELVKQLRENTKISSGVREKERKISLLAENKYTAELMNQKGGIIGYFQRRKTMSHMGEAGFATSAADGMIKENINLYGNLFYLLQTNAKYLSKCLFLVPQSDLDQFLNTVTLTLFGYAFNPREEYLILNLFNETLQLEVQNSTLDSFLSGNPILIKLLITYCHERISGKAFLQKVLYDKIIDPILEEKDLNLDLNPITLLREINSNKEIETGIKINIDYKEVTYEKAMELDETVRNTINSRKEKMIQICQNILDSIYDNVSELPYGLRYVCRQLRSLLQKKYPTVEEKKINQVISYVLFYRYLNAPLCGPDVFNLTKKKISPAMRNNLGNISKVLTRVSTNREFEAVDTHMMMMNEWIQKASPMFNDRFLNPSLQIVEPEEVLGVHQYIELTQKKSPSITITINEIAQTHNLLVKFSNKICPPANAGEAPDALYELLQRFKDKIPEQVEASKNEEITLSLVQISDDKNSAGNDDWLDVKPEQLYEITKENFRSMLRYITPLQLGETIEDTIQKSDQYADELLKDTGNMKSEAEGLALKKKIEEIRRALPKLEESLLVSKENHYRKLLIDITKEIQNREELQKKQQREIERLKESLHSLKSHHSFLEDKDASLDEYVQQTLRNYFKKKEKQQSSSSSKGLKVKTYKFSYKDLTEKYKVIQDLISDDSATGNLQKKAVKFSISMDETEPGLFKVVAKLAALVVSTIEIRLDELLDKREKGQQNMKVDGVVLDVNMTIHLLNKKFLSKQ